MDMDGVIADFDHAIKQYDPSHGHNNYEASFHKVNSICEQNPYIFHTLNAIDGAVESVKQLFPIYDVYFLTVPMWNLPDSFTGKRIWIHNHFGKDAEQRLILTHRKDLNIGDYLIDDSLRHGVDKFTGRHIHFGSEAFPDWDATLKHMLLEHDYNLKQWM